MNQFPNIEEYIDENEQGNGGGIGWRNKFKNIIEGRYFVPIIIALIAVIAFSLGRVSGLQEKRAPVRVLNNTPLTPLLQQEGGTGVNNVVSGEVKGVSNDDGQVIASKNGTKYHYPWCAGAKQIAEKNKISFDSIEEARAAGYTPASNCKGLR